MTTFEYGGVCICADYGLNENGTVSVFNQQRTYTHDGAFKSIRGFAQEGSDHIPGHLEVQLGGMPFFAPYWIIQTGPLYDGGYDYIIVTDSLQLTMWVLVRDLGRYFETYDAFVQIELKEFGFTKPWNSPLLTNQTNCSYEPEDSTLANGSF